MIGSFVLLCVLPLSPQHEGPAAFLGNRSEHKLPEGRDRAVVPFRFVMNQVRIDATVNGKGPFHLVLDTGMPIRGLILFQSERVADLGLDDSGQRIMVGGAGSGGSAQSATLANENAVTAGELEMSDVTVIVMPERAGMPPGMDGIIGGELFFSSAVRIDRTRSRLEVFAEHAFTPDDGAVIVPLHRRGGMAFVDVAVAVGDREPVPAEVVVDIGAGHAISLNTREDGSIAPPDGAIDTVIGRGMGGAVHGRLGRVKRLELGPFAFENVVASFPVRDHASPEGRDPRGGNLGEEILKRFDVTFDYANERMVLEKGQEFDEPFEADMSGLALAWTDEGELVVDGVVDDSPAARAGLACGDRLLSIDGQSAEKIAEGSIKKLLTRDGVEVAVTVRRGDETIETRFRLRRLV